MSVCVVKYKFRCISYMMIQLKNESTPRDKSADSIMTMIGGDRGSLPLPLPSAKFHDSDSIPDNTVGRQGTLLVSAPAPTTDEGTSA